MKVQSSVPVWFVGAQSHSQHSVHQIKNVILNVKCPVLGVRVEKVIADPPAPGVLMVVNDDSESGNVGDVNERVFALGSSNVDDRSYEQRTLPVLILGELVAGQ